jgi:hypothetical protein
VATGSEVWFCVPAAHPGVTVTGRTRSASRGIAEAVRQVRAAVQTAGPDTATT